MARATSSLPTPLSPRISTVTSLSATCSMTVAMPRIFSLLPQTARSSSSLSCWRRSRQLGHQTVLLDRVLDRDVERDLAEPLRVVRLDDVVGGAEPDRLDDGRGLVAARQHDDLRFGPAAP